MSTLKRSLMIVSVAAVAIAPGVALAANGEKGGNDTSNAAKAKHIAKRACQAERRENRAAFRDAYGKNAMRNCKREARGEVPNAAQECRAERAENEDQFKEDYGSNKNKRNAMGKCVSSKVRASVDPEPDDEEAETETS